MSAPVKRDLRAARRAETEARLVDAATALFLERGYAATSLADVAERAGLAARTLYLRFSGKADLLHRCVGVAIAGDAEPVAIADRSWMEAAMAAPTLDERIARMASISATLMERSGPILEVAQQAAATEPAIAAAAQAGREDTRRTLLEFWRRIAEDGLLPAGADVEWLSETTAVLVHAETYLVLAKTTAWDIATYETWLAASMRRLVAGSTA